MNFVADESVDQPIISRLRADGHHVEVVSELSPGNTDDEVLFLTTDQGAVLLTADKDFGELVFRQGRASTGVVLIRLSGLSANIKEDIVSRVIKRHSVEFSRAFSVIEHGQVRIRRPVTQR